MYEIALTDFRGFHAQDYVEIRPLTVLVGENSAGKSSFLAAIKFSIDAMSDYGFPSFNNDPFQLGTFQQIAHFRGGKAGRAKEFHLSIKKNVSHSHSKERSKIENVNVNLTFMEDDAAAVARDVTIYSSLGNMLMSTDSKKRNMEYVDPTGKSHIFDILNKRRSLTVNDLSVYWRFAVQEILFRTISPGMQSEGDSASAAEQAYMRSFVSLIEKFSRDFSGHVEATSAIRTKPHRTYTPGTQSKDSEGSHVPYEIAALYRSKGSDTWVKTKKIIEDFGRSSEMFRKIEVRSFGSSPSDPFQIQFSLMGPKVNLVDLGYGTSQILPLLHLVANSSGNTTLLIQQPEVHLHPRAQAALGEFFSSSMKTNGVKYVIETHSDFLVDRIRQAVSKKIINEKDVSILFFERRKLENVITRIELDSYGEPVDPPENYRRFFIGEQMRNLGID